jgi:hypothetical protein
VAFGAFARFFDSSTEAQILRLKKIDMSKHAIITSGNDPQVSFAIGMFRSAREPNRGQFSGECLFATSGITEGSKQKLESHSIRVIELSHEYLLPLRKILQSDVHPFGKVAKMLLYGEVLKSLSAEIDWVILQDPDILWQKPVEKFINGLNSASVTFATEPVDVGSNPTLLQKLLRPAQNQEEKERLASAYCQEINTGFFAGNRDVVSDFLEKFGRWQISSEMSDYAETGRNGEPAWHDQDYFRYYIVNDMPGKLKLIDSSVILHLVGWAYNELTWSSFMLKVKLSEFELLPYAVHFASSWQRYIQLWLYFGHHITLAETIKWIVSSMRHHKRRICQRNAT